MLGLLGICGVDAAGGPVMGDIPASLRFRGAQDLSLTLSGAPTTWTIFVAVKRAALGEVQVLASSRLGGVYSADFGFDASDQLRLELYNGYYMTTTGKYFRDPTNWLLITLNVTDGGAINCYVADQLVGTGTAPASLSYIFNSSATNKLGVFGDLGVAFFKGYMARFCYVAGSALSYTSFIEYDATANEWKSKDKATIKAVVDAGGADSRMYDWQDGTSLATLGYDYSAKGNNATLNNFSLTAGSTYDWMLDVPGNSFATMNPIAPVCPTLSNGNLKITDGQLFGIATQQLRTGKWYAEMYVVTGGTASTCGVAKNASPSTAYDYVGSTTDSYGYNGNNGNKYNNGSAVAYGASYTSGDVVGMLFDADAGTLEFTKNGVSQGVAFTGLTGGSYFFAAEGRANEVHMLFGQAPLHASATYDSASGGYFRYTPPSGYKALCQANMAEGTITTSGSFTGTAAADGPVVNINGVPTAMTINGNAVTWGTHADALSNGFKIRTASASYNNSGSNTFSVTSTGPKAKYALARGN